MIRYLLAAAVGAVLLLGMALGCSGSKPSDPKSAVIAMFGAMEKNDRATLAHLLDLAELMKNLNEDYALQTDEPRRFTNPEQILDDLTEEGKTKQRWFSMQRIINEVNVIDQDRATVEVTFVDKENSRGYRTKFGVHKVQNRWKIYSFNVYQSGA